MQLACSTIDCLKRRRNFTCEDCVGIADVPAGTHAKIVLFDHLFEFHGAFEKAFVIKLFCLESTYNSENVVETFASRTMPNKMFFVHRIM